MPMKSKVSVKTLYSCSLERAFKTPMLCDVSKVHTGFGMMPKVTHCTNDESWGKPGGSRKIHIAKNISFKGGESSLDTVIERIENKYWKIEVTDFKFGAMGFKKFVGEWAVMELEPNKVQVTYSYTMHSKYGILFPAHWLLTKTFWRTYMKRVLRIIHGLAQSNEPYKHL